MLSGVFRFCNIVLSELLIHAQFLKFKTRIIGIFEFFRLTETANNPFFNLHLEKILAILEVLTHFQISVNSAVAQEKIQTC